MRKWLIIVPLLAFIIFYGCSASSPGRYGKSERNSSGEMKAKTYKEDFNLTPYRETINVKGVDLDSAFGNNNDVWYNFKVDSSMDTTAPQIIGQTDGYRVQIFVTDNLEEADSTKDDAETKLNEKDVYISFDPPFYKVKIGDFKNYADAKDFRFKLNQLGYSEARIVNDKINLFNK